MKLKVVYSTNKKKLLSLGKFQFVEKQAELTPIRIIRIPCGIGAASKRYYYQADFFAPNDSAFAHYGTIRVNIQRKLNPHFNPKNFNWNGNVAECGADMVADESGGIEFVYKPV